MKTSNTSIEEFKYSVSTQIQFQLSLNLTQSQLNSTSTQTTELGTTQLNLFTSIFGINKVLGDIITLAEDLKVSGRSDKYKRERKGWGNWNLLA